MQTQFAQKDKEQIETGIRGKYVKVAKGVGGLFKYPTGRTGLEGLTYDSTRTRVLPDVVADSFCGVGNPFALGPIQAGERVLDIGCGTGVDTFIAAQMVGPTGKAVGIDLVPEMLDKAEENLALINLENVIFKMATAENLPFADAEFDVVTSNGAFNLIPDKAKALTEIFRILKPGGRLMIADQILVGQLQPNIKKRIKSWFR